MENSEEQRIHIFSEGQSFKLYEGSMLDMFDVIEPNSIDAIVTDPPYELNFMNKGWDNSGIAFQKETWEKCLKVLKPGGYLLSFGGSRTFHRIACAIEDAGFEIRDTIMYLYGCLSEDTEVLTQQGFKQFHKITDDDKIRIYDIKSGIYSWEKPERWNAYKAEQDTCYRIKSDSTDQLVSRNHRCLVEREGSLVFEFAENLRSVERVPVLSYDIPYLQEGGRNILLTDLLWQDERLAKELFTQWVGKEESKERASRGIKFRMERWRDISQEKRELYVSKYKVCEVSERIYNDGEKRWLCDGASSIGGKSNSTTFIKDGGCSSYQSQCRGQQIGKSDVVCDKSRPQELREWKTYQTTVATVTKEEYSGIIYCPTVSTGCFVARRNGKVFITGNSGFPKSMNIGLAVDKENGVESEVVGIKHHCQKDFKENNLYAQDPANRNNTKCFGYGDEIVRQAQNEWQGWGTALKPAYEPVIVARKPCEGSCIDNVMKYGVGGINIDECRIGTDVIKGGTAPNFRDVGKKQKEISGIDKLSFGQISNAERIPLEDHTGRFPANVILTYDETDFDEVCGSMPTSGRHGSVKNQPNVTDESGIYNSYGDHPDFTAYTDEGSAARYFYCAKASKRDRDEGLPEGKHNIHPTVKNTDLMQYLVRLVTPKGGTILDPFNGSGSTGKAVMYENKDRNARYKYIGIELTSEYLPISDARIRYAIGDTTPVEYKTPTNPPTLKKPSSGFTQISLFDLPE